MNNRYLITVLALAAWVGSDALAAKQSWRNEPSWASTAPSAPGMVSNRSPRKNLREPRTVPFAPGSVNIALDIGQIFLMGDLGDSYSDNIGGQLHYTYGVSEIFGFDASLGYSSHDEGRYTMTTLLTGLRTNLSWYDRVVPYLVFGLGFYRPSIEVEGSTQSISPILFGLHLGPGVDLQISRSMFFGTSLTFHNIFGTRKSVPSTQQILDIGGTYTAFLIRAGVTF